MKVRHFVVAGVFLLSLVGTAQGFTLIDLPVESVGDLRVNLGFEDVDHKFLGETNGLGIVGYGAPDPQTGDFMAAVSYKTEAIGLLLPAVQITGFGPVRPVGDIPKMGVFDLKIKITDLEGKPVGITDMLGNEQIGVLLDLMFPVSDTGQPLVPGSRVSLLNPVPVLTPSGPIVLVAHPGLGTPLPEPSILLLLGTGFAGLGAAVWRRRRGPK